MTETFSNPASAFGAQMQAFDPARAPGSEQPLELLLDDNLPLRVTLLAGSGHWVIEAFAYDAVAIHGPLRRMLLKTLLQVNGAALDGRQIICTLDAADLVVVMTRWHAAEARAADEDGDDFLSWLEYTVDQARRIREAVRALAMHGADLDWQPLPEGAAP